MVLQVWEGFWILLEDTKYKAEKEQWAKRDEKEHIFISQVRMMEEKGCEVMSDGTVWLVVFALIHRKGVQSGWDEDSVHSHVGRDQVGNMKLNETEHEWLGMLKH